MIERPCNTHFLKILPKWFEDVKSGKKKFEIRRNDRNFETGDILVLQEYEKGKYTGREIQKEIEYIYIGNGLYGLSEDFCILGIKDGKTIEQEIKWIPVSERLPETFDYVYCTCHSLIDDREDWVVETVYIPQLSDSPYSDWGNIPILNWKEAEVVAWMYRDTPKPYKAESEDKE